MPKQRLPAVKRKGHLNRLSLRHSRIPVSHREPATDRINEVFRQNRPPGTKGRKMHRVGVLSNGPAPMKDEMLPLPELHHRSARKAKLSLRRHLPQDRLNLINRNGPRVVP